MLSLYERKKRAIEAWLRLNIASEIGYVLREVPPDSFFIELRFRMFGNVHMLSLTIHEGFEGVSVELIDNYLERVVGGLLKQRILSLVFIREGSNGRSPINKSK